MQAALSAQLNDEFYSAYLYLSMSAHCSHTGFNGAARWLEVQYEEEHLHATKIFNYLIEQGVQVELRKIKQPPTDFGSLLEVFEASLAHEQEMTAATERPEQSGTEREGPRQLQPAAVVRERTGRGGGHGRRHHRQTPPGERGRLRASDGGQRTRGSHDSSTDLARRPPQDGQHCTRRHYRRFRAIVCDGGGEVSRSITATRRVCVLFLVAVALVASACVTSPGGGASATTTTVPYDGPLAIAEFSAQRTSAPAPLTTAFSWTLLDPGPAPSPVGWTSTTTARTRC